MRKQAKNRTNATESKHPLLKEGMFSYNNNDVIARERFSANEAISQNPGILHGNLKSTSEKMKT
jgi:hypothetical protein